MLLDGVHRSGIVNTKPGIAQSLRERPRSLASTGIPLAIASIGTRPNDSRQSDGINTNRLTP